MTVLSQTERDRFRWMKILLSLTFLITCVLITSTISLTISKKSLDLQTDIHNEIPALTLKLHEDLCELHKVIKPPLPNNLPDDISGDVVAAFLLFGLLVFGALVVFIQLIKRLDLQDEMLKELKEEALNRSSKRTSE